MPIHLVSQSTYYRAETSIKNYNNDVITKHERLIDRLYGLRDYSLN